MDIYEIRNRLKSTGRTLADLPLRVVYYARVSTDKDEQLNSLDNQRSYYEDFITANKNWQMAGSYIDEGLSGITTKNREKFHSMIDAAKAGKFDFVITKEISRFARNTLDSIQFTRELLSHGVAIWFQQDSINTIDDDSEMRLAIMSSLAQEESRRLSSRIRFGHSEAIKKGTVMGNSRIYGYDKAGGKLVINEREAEMVRLVYELYATGNYSTPKIERILEEKGYRNFKGGLVNRNVLRKIIPNPKYKGYYCGNKVKIVDMFTKKQKFLNESEWEMYPDHDRVPPIVSEELWERANVIFAIRSAEVKERRTSFKTDNLFTGKIVCAEHGVPFYMKQRSYKSSANADPTWVCSHRIKNGKNSCATVGLRETELTEIMLDVLNGLSGDFDGLVEQYMQLLEAVQDDGASEIRLNEIKEEIAKIAIRKEKLIDLAVEGQLSNAEVGTRNTAYNEQIAALELEMKKIKGQQKEQADYSNTINRFKKELRRYFDSSRSNDGVGELSPGIINALIDKIYVTATPAESKGVHEMLTPCVNTGGNEIVPSSDVYMMQLEIRLNTGLAIDRNIQKIGSRGALLTGRGVESHGLEERLKSTTFPLRRSGDTFKKMIEAQERQMAGK